MRRVLALGLLGALASCRSMADELADLRAEIARLEKEVPPEAPLWISEGPNAFEPYLEDYSLRVPDFIYNHLLRKLAQMPPEQITAQSNGSFSPDGCFKDPAACRGRFWKAFGSIANLEPLPVGERSAGVQRVYSGVLFMDGRPVLFHVVDKPEFVTIGHDVVEITGVFVKILSYTARNGRKVDAPFLMGRRMGKYY